jgi:hypothetical protein
MTKATGFIARVVDLAALFNNAVDCFEYVQLDRSIGVKEYQICQLKLDIARLRLSRWGKTLHLDEDVHTTTSVQDLSVLSDSTIKQAGELLGEIAVLFADAENMSSKYKNQTAPQDDGLEVYDPQKDLDPLTATLHEKLRQLYIRRYNPSGVWQKAKWTLYKEKHLRRLIEDITELTDGLVELLPATQQIQRDLCDSEVSAIGGNGGVWVLEGIAAAQDKFLEQAFTKIENGANKTHHIVFSGSGNTGIQIGHNSVPISGFVFGRGG